METRRSSGLDTDVELIEDRSVCIVAVVVGRESRSPRKMLDAPA